MNRYSWSVMVWVVLFAVCVNGMAVFPVLAAAEKELTGATGNDRINRVQEGKLRFMGMAEPWERYSVILLPGENIEQVYVKRGEQVKKGGPLLRLTNDQLSNSIGDLIRKKNEIRYNVQQASLLGLEIELKEKYVAQIDAKIKKEKELVEEISGYSSQVSKQLQQQRRQLSDQLSILRARNSITMEQADKNQELESFLQMQIDKLAERQRQLDIKAPFAGRIFYIVEDHLRVVPGRPVCELWNENSVMVRGKIMQHQYSLVHSGDKVRISMEFSTEDKLAGVIHSIEQGRGQERDPRLMRGYATFSVLIKVDDPRWLKPGMMVSVEMVPSSDRN